MKGKVETVLGPLEPENLGLTLTHEHLLHELKKSVFKHPIPSFIKHAENLPICMESLGYVRQYPYSYNENIEFGDPSVRTAVKQEMDFYKKNGGGTIVDNCSIGIRALNHSQYLVELSKKSGINIVAGTGYYVDCSQTESTLNSKVEAMLEKIKQDLLVGMDGTNVKCGVIGEVGCSWPLTDFEKRSLQATALAQQETGAPVIIHPGRDRKSPDEIFRVFQEAGGNVRQTVMSHLDRTLITKEDLLEFASHGSYLEYDLFGTECSLYQIVESIPMPSDAQRMQCLSYLIEEGYGDRIVIAHDIHTKHRLMKFGGHGFSHIILNVVPRMHNFGISQEDLKKMLYANPKDWLTPQ